MLIVAALVCLPGTASARDLQVGPGREFRLPSAAAASARDGDHVLIYPGEYKDCATWTAPNLTIEGVGDASRVVVSEKICGWKAIFVTVGDNITVRNLTLARAKLIWGNAAGIRAEGKDLVVDGVHFVRDEDGILSGVEGGSMRVRNSLFDHDGACIQACALGVYAGHLDLLVVEHSRFLHTQAGHSIKSRARRTEVTDCTILDGADGTSSYAIEAPNGGALLVRGNQIEKGPKTGNKGTAISIGAEGALQPTPEIVVEGNRFRNAGDFATAFVTNLTETAAVLKDNALSGMVTPLKGMGANGLE